MGVAIVADGVMWVQDGGGLDTAAGRATVATRGGWRRVEKKERKWGEDTIYFFFLCYYGLHELPVVDAMVWGRQARQ